MRFVLGRWCSVNLTMPFGLLRGLKGVRKKRKQEKDRKKLVQGKKWNAIRIKTHAIRTPLLPSSYLGCCLHCSQGDTHRKRFTWDSPNFFSSSVRIGSMQRVEMKERYNESAIGRQMEKSALSRGFNTNTGPLSYIWLECDQAFMQAEQPM